MLLGVATLSGTAGVASGAWTSISMPALAGGGSFNEEGFEKCRNANPRPR